MENDPQILTDLLAYFEQHARYYWPSIKTNRDQNPEIFDELASTLANWSYRYLGNDYAKILCEGYTYFSVDVNRCQVKYERDGHYENKTYQEVYEKAYDNAKHMNLYHWGVYVTHFAWFHHLKIYQFFKDHFLPKLQLSDGKLIDLGSGSGIWSMLASTIIDNWAISGIDISETSVDASLKMAQKIGIGNNVRYAVGDALSYTDNEQFDAGISCYLLEHLENPQELLNNLSRNIKTGGVAFVTAALTAAEVDHISEFRKESEIICMAEKAGFRVLAFCSEAPPQYPKQMKFLPRSMALVLQKRRNDIW